MAYNFPDAPTLNQTFNQYKWDGEKWILTVGGRPYVSSWTPAFLTGLIGWWDSLHVVLSGSNVTSVTDQSGNGNNLTGVNNPTIALGQWGTGLDVITFAFAGPSFLANTSFPLGTGNSLTAFAVLQRTVTGTGYSRYISYTAPGASHDYDNVGSITLARNSTTDNVLVARNNTGPTSSGTAVSVSAKRRLIMTVKSDGTCVVYIDNTATSGTVTTGNWVSAGYLAFGGSKLEPGVPSDFYLAEAGIATGYSDATMVGQLDTYLKTKWGL